MSGLAVGAGERLAERAAGRAGASAARRSPPIPPHKYGNPLKNSDRTTMGGMQNQPQETIQERLERGVFQKIGVKPSKAEQLARDKAKAALPHLENCQGELDKEIDLLQAKKAQAKLDGKGDVSDPRLESLYDDKTALSEFKDATEKQSMNWVDKGEKWAQKNNMIVMAASMVIPMALQEIFSNA